jgi:hypothetical protein
MSGGKKLLKSFRELKDLLPEGVSEAAPRQLAGAKKGAGAKLGANARSFPDAARNREYLAFGGPTKSGKKKKKAKKAAAAGKAPSASRAPRVTQDPNFEFEMLPDGPGIVVRPQTEPVQALPRAGAEALGIVLAAIGDVRYSVAEARPTAVSVETRREIEQRLSRGARILRERPSLHPDGFVIGMDFGTSSTKVVVHQPFMMGDPSKAIPVPPELRSGGLQHLWQTALWFSSDDGSFSLFPKPGAVALEGFKAGIIQGQGARSDAAGVPRSLAAAAYIGLLFGYVVGYFDETQPLGRTEVNHCAALHLGIPVASKDHPTVRPEFERIADAAWSIAQHADGATVELVERAYDEASPARVSEGLHGIRVYGELEGVIAGYLATPDQRPGPHMVVDVGASTLDAATFRLYVTEGERRADVYATEVEILGAEALNWASAAGVAEDDFRRACGHVAWKTFHDTRRSKDRGFDRTTGVEPVKFLFVGGGRHTDLHSKLFDNPPKDIYLGAPTTTPAPANATVSEPGVDFARLLVAYGLSRDPSWLPKTRLPSQVQGETGRSMDIEDRYIYD